MCVLLSLRCPCWLVVWEPNSPTKHSLPAPGTPQVAIRAGKIPRTPGQDISGTDPAGLSFLVAFGDVGSQGLQVGARCLRLGSLSRRVGVRAGGRELERLYSSKLDSRPDANYARRLVGCAVQQTRAGEQGGSLKPATACVMTLARKPPTATFPCNNQPNPYMPAMPAVPPPAAAAPLDDWLAHHSVPGRRYWCCRAQQPAGAEPWSGPRCAGPYCAPTAAFAAAATALATAWHLCPWGNVLPEWSDVHQLPDRHAGWLPIHSAVQGCGRLPVCGHQVSKG